MPVLLTDELATMLETLLREYNAEKFARGHNPTSTPNDFTTDVVICKGFLKTLDDCIQPAPDPEDPTEEDELECCVGPRDIYEAKLVSWSNKLNSFCETIDDIWLMETFDRELSTDQLYIAQCVGEIDNDADETISLYITQVAGGGGGSDTMSLSVLTCVAPTGG